MRIRVEKGTRHAPASHDASTKEPLNFCEVHGKMEPFAGPIKDELSMATTHPDHRAFRFGEFTLDLERGALFRAGTEVKLRPKSFEVLSYLVRQHGRLVSKDELLSVVWADAFVTDGSLTQCVIDVRRALGDFQHIVKTVPRRGYILDAPVIEAERTRSQDLPMNPTAPPPRFRHWRWVTVGLVAAIVAVAIWLMPGMPPGPGSEAAGEIRSIAVLPLENLSGDPDQEYFADGITEQLIADLARIGGLRVISRTSIMQYRGSKKPVRTIVRELGIDALIEGSVVRAGDKVRITAKLIRGTTGEVVWAQSYERDLRDVMALQRDVARSISSEVGITLTPQEQASLAGARPVDPEVHLQVLLGRYHLAKATEEGVRKALQYFDVAIAKDPDAAPAHAGLAEAYMGLSGFYVHPREIMPNAKRAAETALRLDESLADAHAALGYIYLVYDWDGPAAEQALLRALDLNPTLASARLSYAAYLASQARHDEAAQQIRRAVDLDPLSVRTHSFGSMFLNFTRRYDEAIELARKGLELDPNAAFALAFQGVAYAEQGRFTEAVNNLQRAATLDGSLTILSLQAHVLATAGHTEQARRVIRQVEEASKHRYFCPYEIGCAYVSLGDAETAFEWFRKGVQDRADCMPWLGVEPWLDPIRTDPRYASLLKQIGLAPHAR
jgi:TolB-like protein/DNA-binding winged helix-turn-helix (wHTH) protein/Tfp pilus assembly protein PilF